MKIKSVRLKNVTVHKDSTLTIPENGISLICGKNGSGKSSFIEGIAYALYNRSMRGAGIWAGTEPSSIELVTTTHEVTRTRIHTRNQDRLGLTWNRIGEEAVKYETPTKAQNALEQEVIPFNVWCRTSVLSSSDANSFTLAQDADRKRLLEAILNLDRFDKALEAAKEDLKEVESAYQAEAYEQDRMRVQRAEIDLRLQNAKDSLAACPPDVTIPEGLEAKVIQLSKMATDAAKELREARDRAKTSTGRLGELKGKYLEVERRAKQLATDACPTCEQAIPSDLKKRLDKELEEIRLQVVTERAAITDKEAASAGEIYELETEHNRLETQKRTLAEKFRTAQQAANLRSTLSKQLADAERDLNALLAKPLPDLTNLKIKVATHRAVVEVLGVKGFRSHLLTSALNGIQTATNEWLHKISDGRMSIELEPYTQMKSGSVSDSISLRIRTQADGDARPYIALSGGERRRVDVSLLMGLAEVAQAANGVYGGTLFLDEAADALDSEGVASLCATLNEMSATRSIVVITHNPEIMQQIKAVQRINL